MILTGLYPYDTTGRPRLNAPRVVVAVAPGVEPITLADAKLFLHVEQTVDDALITGLITAARSIFEKVTGRRLITQQLVAYWDLWPRIGTYAGAGFSREVQIPAAPLISVQSVKYLDDSATLQTAAGTDYTVEAGLDPDRFSRLRFNASANLPAPGDYPDAVQIAFTAGYGAAAANVPPEIIAAIRLLVSHFYENRQTVVIGNIVNELPLGLQSLIDMHRLQSAA